MSGDSSEGFPIQQVGSLYNIYLVQAATGQLITAPQGRTTGICYMFEVIVSFTLVCIKVKDTSLMVVLHKPLIPLIIYI